MRFASKTFRRRHRKARCPRCSRCKCKCGLRKTRGRLHRLQRGGDNGIPYTGSIPKQGGAIVTNPMEWDDTVA